jgi:CRISPR-associated protein Csb2
MFALAIHYLNGWAMAAADGARKEMAEWPPHPDRVFMALAAAWFETGEDPAEGDALRWLEALEPPAIAASNAYTRHAMGSDGPTVSYVPVNDARMGRKAPASDDLGKLKEAGLAILPEQRPRQPRGFPVAIPEHPTVHLIWSGHVDEHRDALERLARKVTHVGHSSSFVQVWIEDAEVKPTWIPVQGIAQHRLRVPDAGRLEYLAKRCNRDEVLAYAELTAQADALKGKEKKRVTEIISARFGNRVPLSQRPEPRRWQGYARPVYEAPHEAAGSVFDPRLIVLALSGRRPSLPATLKLTEALRGALMSACPEQPPPEWLSGHTPDRRATSAPHLAFLPLPFVGSEHADGRVMGLAIALPVGLDPNEASRCLGPFLYEQSGMPQISRLFDGQWFECMVALDTRETPPASLRAEAWTGESRMWASVTPVVFDRHFDGKDKWERAAEGVKDACERIGLPRPSEVLLHSVSLFEGAPHAREFPQLTRKSDGGRRHHSHAVIVFDEPVRGPVVIGAGRFRGYGLCRPLQGRSHHG